MSAKSTSPEAAQKKVWREEIKGLRAEKRATLTGARNDTRAIDREIAFHEKEVKKLAAQGARLCDGVVRKVEELDRRIDILVGRVSG